MNEIAQVIAGAAALLDRPGAWCQSANARNRHGESVEPYDAGAVSFCAQGAVMRAAADVMGYVPTPGLFGNSDPHYGDLVMTTLDFLSETVPSPTVVGWNDAPQRTRTDMVSLMHADARRAVAESKQVVKRQAASMDAGCGCPACIGGQQAGKTVNYISIETAGPKPTKPADAKVAAAVVAKAKADLFDLLGKWKSAPWMTPIAQVKPGAVKVAAGKVLEDA